MCGRYYSLFDKQQIAQHFHVHGNLKDVVFPGPDYNVTPDSMQPVIRRNRETGERELVMMRWGIVPWFAKTEIEFKKLSTINAKSDRLTASKMWREPFAKRRCLVPASGLYEWPKEGKAISRFYDQVPTVEEEAGDFDNLFGTSMKAPKKTRYSSSL
jgi:putative SOS response-associated peptidase YedK